MGRELNLKIKKILRALRDLFFGEDIILMYVPFWLREEYLAEIGSTRGKFIRCRNEKIDVVEKDA